MVWRLVVAEKTSSLSSSIFTGRPVLSVIRHEAHSIVTSILPPKAPPTTVWMTRILSSGSPVTSASCL